MLLKTLGIKNENMKRIQDKLHKIGTFDVSKTFLSCSDDKIQILHDGNNGMAYFHEDVRSQ